MKRYLTNYIKEDLKKKMVFLGGPRQVGKTTLSKDILNQTSKDAKGSKEINSAYLSWDFPEDKRKILDVKLPKDEPLIVLDEIHKYRKWRNLIKGIYDKYKDLHSFLITGSAKLDYYRRGGDSLQGRYHYYRLHPLSAGELISNKIEFNLEDLLKFGGFPEPFFLKDERDYKRWQRDRASRVIKEDLLDLEKVMDVSHLQILVELLPSKVGSPLSIKSLAEDLEVAHSTVKRWITILDNLYYSFRVSPFGAPKIRAVKKEQKLYLWDWSLCEDEGSRFENLVACQLLKHCHFIEDTEGDIMELRYLRDTDKREVDFIVLKNKKAIFGVECKLSETNISPHLKYFAERTKVPTWYQLHLNEDYYEKDGITVIPFLTFVKKLNLV